MDSLNSQKALVHRGFEAFSEGRFEDGGSNLYVNANGVIETIHRTDLNNDGYVDIVMANSHGYIERGPTWIYKPDRAEGVEWKRRELPNDSGWMSRVADVDGDGYPDLVVANGENGVTSELPSYVYWGGPSGLTGECLELPTVGAYDVAVVDVNRDGHPDLVFPSPWVDHHNAGRSRPLHVFVQTAPRVFKDASEDYGLNGFASMSIACSDLNGDGRPDLVVANYRKEFEYDTESFVYWGTEDGFDADAPLRLPTHYALKVTCGDLNGDGLDEIIFCGGDQVMIYWNDRGRFDPAERTIIDPKGFKTMFCQGAVNATVSDVDLDGRNELILATEAGVEIRSPDDLHRVSRLLPLEFSTWVHAADLDGDGRPELIASKYDDRVSYETTSAIFWNGPEGFSEDRSSRVPTGGAMGCTAGDLDGDGRPEVVFNSTMMGPSQFWEDFPMYVYFGGKEADYGPHRRLELPTGGGSNAYVIADFDLDGHPDLAITTQEGLRVFPSGPKGPCADRYVDLPTTGGHVMQAHVADFNRDGYLDLLASVQTYDEKPESMANSSVIFYGSKEGFSAERSESLPTFTYGQAHLADVDRDGYLDVIFGDKRGYVRIFLGGPDGYDPERVLKIPLENLQTGSFNAADLNGDGWLDLIVGIQSHYHRRDESVYVLYGGPEGYDLNNAQCYRGGYSPGKVHVADYDQDGNLDLLVPAYSSQVTRVLPAQLFRGDGKRIDFEHPWDIPAESACGFLAMDLNRNGYTDLFMLCHRDDLGHQVDSLIFWNGPDGFSTDHPTRLPGMDPHRMTRDPGNAYTREPTESYVSPAFDLKNLQPKRIHWEAEVPETTALKFQLRWAAEEGQLEEAPWEGPGGEGSTYEKSGGEIRRTSESRRWLQYRAEFESLYGCRSARLWEVRVEMGNEK